MIEPISNPGQGNQDQLDITWIMGTPDLGNMGRVIR